MLNNTAHKTVKLERLQGLHIGSPLIPMCFFQYEANYTETEAAPAKELNCVHLESSLTVHVSVTLG